MKRPIWILAVMLAASPAAFAQPSGAPDQNDGPPAGGPPPGPGGPGGHHHRPPPLPIIEALDVNKDHVIDASEIANASAALKTLDKNGDGQLTVDEYMPPPPPWARARGGTNDFHPPVPPIVAALDANSDGVIDASEIANAPAALKTLDKNGDGQLTMDELRPPRPPGPPPGYGDGDNDGPPPGPPPGQGNGDDAGPPPGPPPGNGQ